MNNVRYNKMKGTGNIAARDPHTQKAVNPLYRELYEPTKTLLLVYYLPNTIKPNSKLNKLTRLNKRYTIVAKS